LILKSAIGFCPLVLFDIKLNYMNKFEEILNIISYDDLDEDVKLEQIKDLAKKELNKKPVTTDDKRYVAILNFRLKEVIILKLDKHNVNDEYLHEFMNHSDFNYMELDKFPDINFKNINLFQLLENVKLDVEADNFDIDKHEVDKEFYLKLLKIDL